MPQKDGSIVAAAADMPRTEVSAGTGTSMQVLISAEQAPHFAMRCFTIAPGGGMPAHSNSIEHEQYVLAGRAQVGIGEQVHEVNAGDVLLIPAGIPHWYRNDGDSEFRFLCLVPNQPDQITLVESE